MRALALHADVIVFTSRVWQTNCTAVRAGEEGFVIDSPVLMAPTALSATIDGLSSAPWVRMRSASEALTVLPPEGANLPFPTFAFAPDGKRLACATIDRLYVWNLANGDLTCELPYQLHVGGQLCFTSPDHVTIVTSVPSRFTFAFPMGTT